MLRKMKMGDKIKVVFIIDVLENIAGGAERQIYELIKNINKEKFGVSLLILHQKEVPQEILNLNIEVKGLGIKRIYDFGGIFHGFKHAYDFKKKKIDAIMTYHFSSDIWGTIFGAWGGVPLIISYRRDNGFWRKKLHILTYKLINNWVNKILVVSEAVRRMVIKEEGVPELKVKLIYNGVDLERFKVEDIDIAMKKKEVGLPVNCRIVGAIGNLRPIKGHRFLIEAATEVVKKFSDTHFLLIGEGELKEDLKAKARALNVEKNIHFLGRRMDVPRLLKIVDICVLPSLSEGLSNTLLEYMAAEKPIVATAVGGNTEVISDRRNGILVSSSDSNALAEKISMLLENKLIAYSLGIQAKETVSAKFDVQKQVRRLEEFLEESLGKKKELRVMHLISSGGLFGAEKVMLSLASNMNSNGIKSWVVAIENVHNPHLEVIEMAKKENIPVASIKSKGRLDLKSVSYLCDFIKRNNIGIIHTHNYKADFLSLLAAKKTKIPIVATVHGYGDYGINIKLKVYREIDRFILRYFNKVILVDDSLRKWFKGGHIKHEVINNGVCLRKNNDKNINNDKQNLVIGTVGRLSREKGHKFLLEAMKEILKHNSNIELLIVGEGNLKEALKRQAKDLGISERIIFAGYQNDMHKIYPIIDIVVHPSLREGLPLTLLEAMAFKKAIIATGVGGVGELIKDGVTGLLIKPASSEEITKAVLSLLTNTTLRERLGETARSLIMQNYSIERMINKYKSIYRQVVNLM